MWKQIFSAFFATCRLPPRDKLSWSINHHGLLRLEDTIPSRGFNLTSSFFVISIEGDPPDLQGIPYAIAQGLSSCDLSTITRLDLSFEFGTLVTSNASFVALLSGLTSVETLYTYVSTLSFIIGVLSHTKGSIPLPSLTTLFLKEEEEVEDEVWDTAVIMRFLLQRRDVGVPITTLELPAFRHRQSRFLFLKGINGLEIKWIGERNVGNGGDSDEDSDNSIISVSD